MKRKNLLFCFIAAFTLISINSKAQNSTLSSGTTIKNSTGSISYLVGQVANQSYQNSTGKILQGVQQPYELFVINGLSENKIADLKCTTFPNPTSDFLTVSILDYKNQKMACQLIDLNGKVVLINDINSKETSISTASLPSSTYFLNLTENNKSIQSFKIIKN